MIQTPTAFDIRPARRDDMGTIADLVRSSADWYREIVDEKDMSEHDVDETWAESNFRRRDFYVGGTDGRPLGTISLQYFGEWAYLGYIYLDVDHVGKGYGRKLMAFAEDIARQKGVRGMCLIAHPDASWAKKAYLKYGFEIVERDRQRILEWNGGCLDPHYEEGFELYCFDFDDAHAANK